MGEGEKCSLRYKEKELCMGVQSQGGTLCPRDWGSFLEEMPSLSTDTHQCMFTMLQALKPMTYSV